jgi:hypothetical protein
MAAMDFSPQKVKQEVFNAKKSIVYNSFYRILIGDCNFYHRGCFIGLLL